jgi:hypothetical protein
MFGLATIGEDTIIPLSLRLNGIEIKFSLAEPKQNRV